MADFTRLTLVRDDTRADVVVASGQPLAVLLPRFCDILGLPPGSGPYALVRPIGDSLELDLDCATNNVADGEILHVVDWTDVPAPPAVTDVTDAVADARASLPGVWNRSAQRCVAAVAIGAACLVSGVLLPSGENPQWRAGMLLGLVALLLVVAVFVGRAVSAWVATALSVAAIGFALPGGLAVAALLPAADPVRTTIFAALLIFWVTAGAGLGLGLRRPPAAMGGLVCGFLAVLGLVLTVMGVGANPTWGVVGVAAVVALGLAPTWAISVSGLTGLDDFTSAGAVVERARLTSRVTDAYGMVTWPVAGIAIMMGLAAGFLGALGDGDPWAVGLAAAILVVLALRTRSLPTAIAVGVMWSAVLIGVGALLWTLPPWWRVAGFALLAASAAVVVVVPVAVHVRVRLRTWGTLLEKLATVATLPLLLGVFGVYGYLLGAFS